MTAWLRSLVPASATAIVVAMPQAAAACAVCMGGVGGGSQRAFAIGSLFLSVLPLVVIGAVVLYLRRRAKAIEREASERLAHRAAATSISSHG